ncbi:MAG: 50S ribosomal protein L15 [Candidatus Puniceispirillales bacterium]|jgi:large subunit ribosomal protein L15|nr:50S ribosomal protein L15 [Alphaproteobacteria bacterium]MBL6851191.1 50S ribosomal protein L15 [Alphaproteobacteria bacterium]
MNLNNIKDNVGSNKNRKRIGRGIGSGTGKTSGKGHKGQKARSGVSIKGFEGGQMPIHRRLPKRGFNNINKVSFVEINVNRLDKLIDEKIIDPNKTINNKVLMDIGLINSEKSRVKLLANGELKNKINIEISAISSSAKDKVEKVGGSVLIQNNEKLVKKIENKSEV